MKAKGIGAVICLSSIMGVAYGWDEHVAYSAAKSGVVGLVRGLAVELARSGIRVNGIAPGYIRTAQALSSEGSRLKREVRLHCSVDPQLLGGAVLRSGDLVIDGSVRGRLERIAHELVA